MRLILGTLLCLSCTVACSHGNPKTAEEANTADQQDQVATGPAPAEMRPASLEDAPVEGTTPRSNDATPSQAGPSTAPSPSKGSSAASPASNTVSTDRATTPANPPGANAPTPGTPPDNTKVNQRDRDSAALTPIDQGNGEADLKMTQQIRQAVMADKSLSFTAKNVKIITRDGKVTLRGPVNTSQERSAIEAAARKVAGAAPVDNQLEVKK